MSTFKYTIGPRSGGGFTTRTVRGPAVEQSIVTDAITAATGVTGPQVEAVIQSFFATLLSCAEGCAWSPELYGYVSFRPTSGGSAPLPTDFHNAEDINADVSLSISAARIDTWRAALTLESQGEVGKVTPLIDTILNLDNSAEDKYSPGNLIQLRGDNLKLNKTDPLQGVFFKAGAAAEVRATIYGTMDPSALTVLVPASLSGPLNVRVAAYINGSIRSFTYTNLITT